MTALRFALFLRRELSLKGGCDVDKVQVEKAVPIKKTDAERQIVYGEVYVPNEKDTDGNFMTAAEIEKMAHGFMEAVRVQKIDKEHNGSTVEGVVVESFIARKGDPDFTEGAWVLGTKVTKAETWEAIKKGEITGYSIAGMGVLIEEAPAKA